MLGKKYNFIIVVQAIIIITLFWVLVFYGRDEYEAFQDQQNEEIAGPEHVSTKNGVTEIKLSPNVIAHNGILIAPLKPASYQNQLNSLGTVLNIQPLIDSKTQYEQLQTQLALVQSGVSTHQAQYKRLKQLNADDKNVSDKLLQEALAVINADQAQISALNQQLKSSLNSIQSQWGTVLSQLVTEKNLAPYLAGLLNQQNVLVQIGLPFDASEPNTGDAFSITTLSQETQAITAIVISPATQSDVNANKTYFVSAPKQYLRTGMRVRVSSKNALIQTNSLEPITGSSPKAVSSPAQNELQGTIIPNTAVVWHSGLPWIYIQNKANTFIRTPIKTDIELNNGWFSTSLPVGTKVVTQGAQLLLSEEFKSLIKNENED